MVLNIILSSNQNRLLRILSSMRKISLTDPVPAAELVVHILDTFKQQHMREISKK